MPNLEINQLRAFLTIVNCGSMRQAADVLNLTQGAISIQIKRLEETTGQRIFSRRHRKLELTPAGDELLDYARQILAINDQALDRLSNKSRNRTIEFGIPPDLSYPFLTQIITQFQQKCPNARLHTHFDISPELAKMFRLGELDFFIGVDTTAQGTEVMNCSVSWYYSGNLDVIDLRPLPIVLGANAPARNLLSRVLRIANIPHEFLPNAADVLSSAAIVNAGQAITIMLDRKEEGHEQFFKLPCDILPEIPMHKVYFDYNKSSKPPYLHTLGEIVADVLRQGLALPEPA